jgi:RNA processing factor Prp31
MLERENVRKFYVAWTKMEKANKSMMSGANPTESQKQSIKERIDMETMRIDNLISSLEKLKEKLKIEAEKMEEYYEIKVSESTAKKL